MSELIPLFKPTQPFEYFVLGVRFCGYDAIKNKPAFLMIFMEPYSGMVFHTQYATDPKSNTLVKFCRVIANKYNTASLNHPFKIITNVDFEEHTYLKIFFNPCEEFITDNDTTEFYIQKCIRRYVNFANGIPPDNIPMF